MQNEDVFRLVLILGFAVVLPVGLYYRLKSWASKDKLNRRAEGLFILLTLRPRPAWRWEPFTPANSLGRGPDAVARGFGRRDPGGAPFDVGRRGRRESWPQPVPSRPSLAGPRAGTHGGGTIHPRNLQLPLVDQRTSQAPWTDAPRGSPHRRAPRRRRARKHASGGFAEEGGRKFMVARRRAARLQSASHVVAFRFLARRAASLQKIRDQAFRRLAYASSPKVTHDSCGAGFQPVQSRFTYPCRTFLGSLPTRCARAFAPQVIHRP